MSSRNSQLLIWTFVALLTAALFAGALKWGKVTIDLPKPPIQKAQFIDLNFIQIQKPKSTSTPQPSPQPTAPVIPPVESPVPEPVAQPEPITQPEPEPSPTPKADPAIVKKQNQAKAARERELARKRIEEKRRQKLNAQKAENARKKAATAVARQRTVSKPSGISQPKPKYPPAARRAGQQGTVTLSFTIGSSGEVISARIAKSSGYILLDNAALSAIRSWRFKPARNALGEAVSYSYTLPVPFRLR
ncbi:MAG: energy transducer TonB [Verrucomicrobiaceae bacterium]|nr:MAG: energy transducer TonB [Verrucomicrobiaceae bacterium]